MWLFYGMRLVVWNRQHGIEMLVDTEPLYQEWLAIKRDSKALFWKERQ